MMHMEKCKWFNGADSPVFFMIDDLANTWVDVNHNGVPDLEEDWGYCKNGEASSFRYLNEHILRHFPQVKVTFFVPVGARAGMSDHPVCRQISLPINADEESKAFFQGVHQHPSYELAYHGTTHGRTGPTPEDFIQEWELFGSPEEAMKRIGEGVSVYADAVGERPRGGKYCGYAGNAFSDESIERAGFTWWCRYWNRGAGDPAMSRISGGDPDPLTNYDIKRFGESGVIDIPSTVDGGLLNGIYRPDASLKGMAKRLLKTSFSRWKLRELDYLLENRLVIGIQEHISPARDDGKRQSPNIFDDCGSLQAIFRYLDGKNVWYCTGSELADYVNLRDHVQVVTYPDEESVFTLEHESRYGNGILSLKLDQPHPASILLPDGTTVRAADGIANLPLMKGEYFIREGETR
ncbi:hypothetical protein CJP46_00350 [Paenibacillus sp. XY044]|nr:hypothetical protein CJP46_00350 [Paenibacillus sp. XY044]